MNQSQHQSQKQILKFSPLQIQLLNLLQLNSMAIEQRIKDEIEENPALEEGKEEAEPEEEIPDSQTEDEPEAKEEIDTVMEEFYAEEYVPDYKTQTSNSSEDDVLYALPAVQRNTFNDQLKEQLQSFSLNTRERKIAHYLVDSLSEDGYLRTPIGELVDDFCFAENMFVDESEMASVLHTLQKCEPAGVAAQSLKECLLLQLENKKDKDEVTHRAIYLLKNYFQEFTNKNYDKIIRDGNVTREELKEALNAIVHLNPKPGTFVSRDEAMINTIIPEFQVTESNGKFEVSLTNQRLPELKLNRKFVDMIDQLKDSTNPSNRKEQKGAIQFVKQKIHAARWFIDAIHQRQATMLKTMEAIVVFQNEFFSSGDFKKIKPMILKDIAERISMDISTVSRVTSMKYVQTSFGVFRIKDFFTSVLHKEDGAEVSNKLIQEIIMDLVEKEDKTKPMSDLEISKKLKESGFQTARRTVAKYREHIGIPIARMRKELV